MTKKIQKNIFLIMIFATISFFTASTIYIIEDSIMEGFEKNNFINQDSIKLKIDIKEDK